MAYLYITGTATDVPNWFSTLEAFLVAIGWTVVAGSGSTTVTFSSPGEAGGRIKLFVRFRRDGALLNRVWYRVQDDVAGTNATTELDTTVGFLDAPGLGAIPFEYFMGADLDKVIANFKAGVGYTGGYVGVLEPFALSVDEEEQMVAVGMHKLAGSCGYVLKGHAGGWDELLGPGVVDPDYIKGLLDDTVAIFALRVSSGALNEIVGQPTDVSGRITSLPGVNPEDIIATAYAGATSTWVMLGTGVNRWFVRTGGIVPVGQLEGANFAHTNGLATSQTDFEARLLTFMNAIGWVRIAHPAPSEPIQYLWYSPGESGIDDIYLTWLYQQSTTNYAMGCADDAALTHQTSMATLSLDVAGGDFPTYYYLTADRDCLFVTLEVAGIYNWMWAGMYQMFMPNPDSYATPYKMGTQYVILRDHAGAWNQATQAPTDGALQSSPNQYDGVTNMVWQFPVKHLDYMLGIVKYVHRISGPAFSIMDTVSIGPRSFRYFNTGVAFREA